MADTTASIEEARRRALEAMAQFGTQGADAYRSAQDQVRAYQWMAVDNALSNSVAQGLGPGAQDELRRIILQPGDMAAQTLASAEGRSRADMAAQQGAASTYFDQAQAGLPVAQAAIDRELAAAAANAASQGGSGSDDPFRYGGYRTAGEYENAVTAVAQDLQEQAYQSALLANTEAREEQQFRNRASAQAGYDRAQVSRVQRPGVDRVAQAGFEPRSLPGAVSRVGSIVGDAVSRVAPRPLIGPPAPPASEAIRRQVESAYEAADRGQQSIAQRTQSGYYQQLRELPGMVADPANLYEYQREAAINYLGGDPLDAEGRFGPPTSDESADAQTEALEQAFVEQFGVAPTGLAQLQRYALGEDPFTSDAEQRRTDTQPLVPEEAAAAAGVPPREVRRLVDSQAFQMAVAAFELGLEEKMSLGAIDRELQGVLMEDLGHDAPQVRALAAAMYRHLYRY